MSNESDAPAPVSAHRLIAGYYSDPARRLTLIRDMFNRTALHYDLANRLFSLGSGAWYRRACLRWAGLRPGLRALDVAVGTGLLAREMVGLTKNPREVIGVDISEAMLAIARRKLGIPLIQATAEALPLPSESIDFIAMGYALRHIADIRAAFREALRVLRPGGKIVVLEISAPCRKFARAAASAYIGGIVPMLSLLTTRDHRARTLMKYHWQTIVNFLPRDAVLQTMTEGGFRHVECWSELDLFHCYVGSKQDVGMAAAPVEPRAAPTPPF